MVAKNVMSNWLSMTIEYKLVTHNRMGFVMELYMGMFYTYDGLVRLMDSEWIQGALNVLIGLL